MPRKDPKYILAAHRAAEASRIVDKQRGLVARLRESGQPTADAEDLLATYLSAQRLLKERLVCLKEERRKKRKPRHESAHTEVP
jgi:hypothetical protein